MIKKPLFALAFTLLFEASSNLAHAQPPAPPTIAMSADERIAVVTELGKQLRENYVFPDVADQVANALLEKAKRDGYVTAGMVGSFADSLRYDLRQLGKDKHLQIVYDPDFKPHPDDDAPPTKEATARQRDYAVRSGYGIAKVERLPGNIGYLDLRDFDSADFVGNAYSASMSLLAGTDALIIDLRQNGGGDPESVTFLLSHFFAQGDQRHLNDLYFRKKNETQQFWTTSTVGERYTNPVYVLTSARTFSAGEECAYDFQTQKRATLIGETTEGGANPGNWFQLGHGFVAFIPTGRAINPVTHTNWEGVGVKPDIAAPAAKAMQIAYADILKKLIAKADAPDQRKELKDILDRVEKGESEQANYLPPH